MKEIKSIEEFKNLTKSSLENKFYNINCFLFLYEIKNLIRQRRLFYLQDESTLQIIIKNDLYFKVYWYGNNEFSFLPIFTNKPIITDLPNKWDAKKMEEIETRIKKIGGAPWLTISRMSVDSKEAKIGFKLPLGVKIALASEDDIDRVYEIWNFSFDTNSNLLYSKEEIKRELNNIYVCKDRNDEIIGAMEVVLKGNRSWLRKIAVVSELKSRGVGTFLEVFYINLSKLLGKKTLFTETNINDFRVNAFHQKFGFKCDGHFNKQFIIKENYKIIDKG